MVPSPLQAFIERPLNRQQSLQEGMAGELAVLELVPVMEEIVAGRQRGLAQCPRWPGGLGQSLEFSAQVGLAELGRDLAAGFIGPPTVPMQDPTMVLPRRASASARSQPSCSKNASASPLAIT